MITIDAHSRDMVQNLVATNADKVDCFQWMCQMRSYWDTSVNDCRIKICDASFPYGYEYLGNGGWPGARASTCLCCWGRTARLRVRV